ncbi:hypothetical protein CAEBREN_06718 [Caenorhabditis brenneri]|uniref:Serpentine Receptor, class H n=1 Tax=Caenorhabditis brenneri TaxID=135651 RepID=G0NHR3_CAEBE|nr:hypothetical protein CAEBREN_06718 [Caenorhabditis brenneri]
MHNLHFLSTPVYIITMAALFRETSQLFQKYKYYLIVHLIANFISEMYVTFMWLPMIHLPYEVYKTTGWLAQLGISGIFQFEALGQFVNLIGVSILEMFYHRFKAVVVFDSQKFSSKLPFYCISIFRCFTFIHFLAFIWATIDNRTIMYQQKKKDELFVKGPDLPDEYKCYTVFIVVLEDPVFVFIVSNWAILVLLGLILIISTTVLINNFLYKARTLSDHTKKMQRMLVISLLAQVFIHGVMIAFPVSVQIYQMMFIVSNNEFGTILLFFVAYHGFFSTCAMVTFTKQIRLKALQFIRCCVRREPILLVQNNQIGASSTNIESTNNA